MTDTNYKLRAWMGANRITQEKLSELLGMPLTTLKARLSGEVQWKFSEILALMKITGMSFEELFMF